MIFKRSFFGTVGLAAAVVAAPLAAATPLPAETVYPYATPVNPLTTDSHGRTVRVINNCRYAIVVRNNLTNIVVPPKQSDLDRSTAYALDYHMPTNKTVVMRYFASAGCDQHRSHCLMGPAQDGGATADTLFELAWPAADGSPTMKPDLSAVDGYTFPMSFKYADADAHAHTLKFSTMDCGNLSLNQCPAQFFSDAGEKKTYDERVIHDGKIVRCVAPRSVAKSKSIDFLKYACPNDDVAGCRENYHMQSNPYRPTDKTPAYVQYFHHYGQYAGALDSSCQLYGFSYDDGFGGAPTARSDSPVVVTFCPEWSPELPTAQPTIQWPGQQSLTMSPVTSDHPLQATGHVDRDATVANNPTDLVLYQCHVTRPSDGADVATCNLSNDGQVTVQANASSGLQTLKGLTVQVEVSDTLQKLPSLKGNSVQLEGASHLTWTSPDITLQQPVNTTAPAGTFNASAEDTEGLAVQYRCAVYQDAKGQSPLQGWSCTTNNGSWQVHAATPNSAANLVGDYVGVTAVAGNDRLLGGTVKVVANPDKPTQLTFVVMVPNTLTVTVDGQAVSSGQPHPFITNTPYVLRYGSHQCQLNVTGYSAVGQTSSTSCPGVVTYTDPSGQHYMNFPAA